MIFNQPWMLWGLLATAIPVAIHLLNRQRHRTVQWAAMQFLLRATKESRGKKKLRNLLILLSRMLAIAMLVFAASLPISGKFFGFGTQRPRVIMLILDRSASMEAIPQGGGKSRRQIALERVQEAVAELQYDRLVLLDSASGAVQEVSAPELLTELSSTAATDTMADIPKLLNTAADFLGQIMERSELWIISDMQASNWQAEETAWENARAMLAALPHPPAVRVLALTGADAPNQSIRIRSLRRTSDELLLDIELERSDVATEPREIPVTTQLNGANSTQIIRLDGQQIRYQKLLKIDEKSEQGFGWLELPADGNMQDNIAFFSYGKTRETHSLIIGGAGEAIRTMQAAAAPPGLQGQLAESVDESKNYEKALGKLPDTAALFWMDELPQGAAAERIEEFLQKGGQAVFIAPEKKSDSTEVVNFLGLSWGEVEDAPEQKYFILDSWDRKDGLLRDGMDGSEIQGNRLRAIRRRVPHGEAAVFAWWMDERPLLMRQVVGRGTAWFLGTRPDYSWSNLGDADVLLPAAQRAVAAGAGRFDAGLLEEVGQALSEEREKVDDYPRTAEIRADQNYLSGVYRIGNSLVAFNRPAKEDEAEVLDTAKLSGLMTGLAYSLFDSPVESSNQGLGNAVWWVFSILMVLALLLEACLCLPKRPKQSIRLNRALS